MPITARPDPNNPGKWIWVDSATGQPAAQPGGAGTPFVAPSDQPGGVNIDPNATLGPPRPTASQSAAQGAAVSGQAAPTLGAPQGAGGMFTPDQLTATQAQAVQQANLNVAAAWEEIRNQQAVLEKIDPTVNPTQYQAATQTLDTLYSKLTSAEQNVQTANVAYGQALDKAIVDPSQVQLQQASAAKARADASTAEANAKVLLEGAPGQRALVAAQAGQASASAAAQQASADATKAKTPAEIQQLQAQASALTAQAAQTNALLPGLVEKQKAEIGLTEAQTNLTGSQSQLAQAQSGLATANANLAQAQAANQQALTTGGMPAAQIGLTNAQATQAQAGAAADLAKAQQALLGPMAGLQDQVNAIRAIQQQVFGPGGSGDPNDANDMLRQYVTATVSGTTPYAASVAAENAGLTQFGTQASLANAAQEAMASRANAFAGAGANLFGTLAGMNANAPAGSTAMVGAFQDVMNNLQSRLASSQFAPPAQPQAPQLPALLAHLAGYQQTGAPAAAPNTFPPGVVGPQAGAPQTSAPVTINIGGSGVQAPTQTQQIPGLNTAAMPGAGPGGQQSTQLPGAFQGYQPASTQGLMSLWGKELGSGAVQMPGQQQPQSGLNVPLPSVPNVY